MNKWTKKTIDFTYQHGYFDRLMDIYPVVKNPKRIMNPSLETRIQNAYDKQDYKLIIKLFNEGVKKYKLKFPIENYYVASLRSEPKWIEKNPELVKSLGKLLFTYDKNKLLKRCLKPKKPSRQLGDMFNNWFNIKFKKDNDLNLLEESDSERKKYAISLIKYHGEEKGLDIFIKINDLFILGEAKFITDSGGTQWNQFSSALKILDTFDKNENVIPLSIIDGHCWHTCNDKFYKAIKNSDDHHIIISALLLEELFEKIKIINVPEEGLSNDEIIELL